MNSRLKFALHLGYTFSSGQEFAIDYSASQMVSQEGRRFYKGRDFKPLQEQAWDIFTNSGIEEVFFFFLFQFRPIKLIRDFWGNFCVIVN